MSKETSPKLVRELSLLDATMIVVGSMIGSGIFIVSAESSRLVGSPGWLLMAWALAGVLTITGALCCAELAAMWPRAGGQYVFLREAYGPSIGFLFGWGLFLIIQTGTIAAVAVAFANFTGVLINWVSADRYLIPQLVIIKPFTINQLSFNGYALSLSTQQLVAVVMILFLTFINTRGLNHRQDHSEHVYVYQNRRIGRFDFDRTVTGLEPQQRGLHFFVVGAVGERLETDCGAGLV